MLPLSNKKEETMDDIMFKVQQAEYLEKIRDIVNEFIESPLESIFQEVADHTTTELDEVDFLVIKGILVEAVESNVTQAIESIKWDEVVDDKTYIGPLEDVADADALINGDYKELPDGD
jgi:hypothetical protein